MLIKKTVAANRFGGEIWKMDIDETTSSVLLEIRNADTKQVTFASFNLATDTLQFDHYKNEERWLIGIESTDNGVLLLHYYQSTKSPVHKGIIAIDTQTGATLWSNYNLVFQLLSVNGPIVSDNLLSPPKLYIADIKNGQLLRPYDVTRDAEKIKDIKLPELTNVTQLGIDIPFTPHSEIVHYAHINNLRIVSLHTLHNATLCQHILIFKNDKLIFKDLLNSDIQKMQPEAFVIHNKWLLYIKNKNELNAIDLNN